MGSKGLLSWSPEDDGVMGWRRLALLFFSFPSQALVAMAALTNPALICGQFLCSGCGHILPDTLWRLDLLLAAASSATSQQFPLFIPCRAGKFFPLCHLSGWHLTASAFVPYSCCSPGVLGSGLGLWEWGEQGNCSCLNFCCPVWATLPAMPPPPPAEVCPLLLQAPGMLMRAGVLKHSELSLLRECTPEQSKLRAGPPTCLLPAAQNFCVLSWLTAW